MELTKMKLLLIIVNLLCAFTSTSNSQHVTLIGSHLLPVDPEYKVHLTAQGLTGDSVITVSLKPEGSDESFKIFENIERDLFQEIDFELPNETLPTYKLKVMHKNKATNTCIKQSITINNIPNLPMIFIQLDKPVYKNSDVIKFRVYVMDRKTVPVSNTSIDVTISDGKGHAIRKFEKVGTSKFGIYKNHFKIAKSPNFGTWKIQVEVDGKRRSKTFQVIKHDKDSFEVFVDTQKKVAFTDKKMFLNIKVKHPKDKIFTGIAKISSTAKFKGSNQVLIDRVVRIADISNHEKITLDIKEDLGILEPNADMIIRLNIEVIEDKTRKSEKVSVDIPMRHKGSKKNPNDSTKLNLELAGTELNDEIQQLPNHGVDEYMQATVLNKSQNVGDTIQISVQSSDQLEALHVLVIGPYGLVYTKDYPDAKGKDVYEFTLELTTAMRPESHVIVFYVRSDDGVIIHDELELSLGYSAENYLDISAPQTGKPNQEVKIDIKSAQGSMVYLTAIDQNSALIAGDNEMSRSSMYNEMYLKYNNASKNQFDRFNAFVMQPVISGSSCDQLDTGGDGTEPENESQPTMTEKLIQKYFPDIWFDEAVKAGSSEVQSIFKQIPNDFTSWRIYGTSVHPTKGFAAVNKEVEMSVNPEIALKVHTPASMYIEEVLKVEFSVFSFVKTPENGQIDVSIENGDLMTVNAEAESDRKCKTYSHKNQSEYSIKHQFSAGSMSETLYFLVKPTKTQMMTIRIAATAGNSKDEVRKIIQIQSIQNEVKVVQASYLVDMMDGDTFEKEVSLNLPEDAELIETEATLSGNLLGHFQDYLRKFIKLPNGYIEQKLEYFSLFLILYDFMAQTKQDVPVEFIDELYIGYQEAIRHLHALHNESMLNDPLMTYWVYAYTVQTVVDFKKYFKVDDREIERALNYIGSKQNDDGSFTDDPVAYVRREMGTKGAQPFILTAHIALTFIKYQKYSDKYEEVITKAVSFLNGSKDELVNDYERAIVAYTLAVYGDKESSTFLTSSMKMAFLKPPMHKQHMSMFVESASYLIMIKIINNEDPKAEIEWLLNQRDGDGSFYSTYSSLLAVEAMLKFSIPKDPKNTKLSINVDDQFEGSIDGAEVTTIPITQKNQHKLQVTGHGFGFVQISYKYSANQHKIPTGSLQENFSIDVNVTQKSNSTIEIEVDVKLIAEGMRRTNLVMIEVEMPSGYQYTGHNDAKHIEMFEHKNDRTMAVFYIDIMEVNTLYKEVIHALRVFEIENPAKSTIKVYDYYRQNVRDELQYELDLNSIDCAA